MQNNEQLIQKLIIFFESQKIKTVTILDIYAYLGLSYGPYSDKLIFDALNALIEEKYIEPIKSSKTNNGGYKKYRILVKNNQEEKAIQTEIINTLVKPIDIQYLLSHTDEYIQNKDFIDLVNNFLRKPDKNILTVNERSYQIFKNEKLLKQNGNFLSKLKLKFEDLYCYDTYEPFFYYQNVKFNASKKIILIIENKDTFWTIKKAIENMEKYKNIYLLIYGEGKKILKSFSFIENFNIGDTYEIQYFGDIDYEGINIYVSLKEKYMNYNIKVFEEGYNAILNLEKNPQDIGTKQSRNNDYIHSFLNEFDEIYKEKLNVLFENNKYIPQEVFNYKVASDLL